MDVPGEVGDKPGTPCVRKRGKAQTMMGAHHKDPEATLKELSLAMSDLEKHGHQNNYIQ